MVYKRLTFFCLFLGCLLISSLSASNSSSGNDVKLDPSIETLFQLIRQRLSYMEAVANYKWHKKLPIEDLEREKIVLINTMEGASNYKLEPLSSKAFFSTQIKAAKEIQTAWYSHWRKQGSPEPGADLTTVIRPQLIELGKQILKQYQLTQSILLQSDQKVLESRFVEIVNFDYLNETTVLNLLGSLQQIRSQQQPASLNDRSNRLDRILTSGEIRVGTTGDYAPFSVLRSPSDHADQIVNYSGIDIDMAKDLANSLGVELTLVATSWPSLAKDFKADKFDLAMGGVSINLMRQRLGFFSNAYHSGGKTPIALCSKASTYDSLEKIDSENTRLIVNPGGTNYRFAKANVTNANLRIYDDNQTIFKEIAQGRADVMITDAIEVRLQSNSNNKLCATMPGVTLTKSEKGYWLQPDLHLKEYVNSWLHQRTIEGFVERLFDRHLNTSL